MKKKMLALILAFALVLSLAGCQSVSKVEDAIAKIGTVTIDSGEVIQEARILYDALSAAEQEKVANADVLFAAEEEFTRLETLVETAVNTINAIGFVDLGSGDLIALARMSYEALEADGLKAEIPAYAAVLEQAEEDYSQIYVDNSLLNATDMFTRGNIEQAEETLADAVSKYPNADRVPACQALGIECIAKLARDQYVNNKLLETMRSLKRCQALYGTSNDIDKLMEDLVTRLEQNRPQNNAIIGNTVINAYGKFNVNASDFDVCVKIELASDPSQYILFFVRAGESATVHVPDGDFIMKYTTGTYWYNSSDMFGDDATFTKADGVFTFETTREGNSIYYDSITVSLYTVADGNLETEDIGSGEF